MKDIAQLRKNYYCEFYNKMNSLSASGALI